MNKVLRKYNRAKRIELIKSCLIKDSYYFFDAGFDIDRVAPLVNMVIETLGQFSFLNPIKSIDGSLVYFKPIKDHIEREGRINSEIKYATHFITKSKNPRIIDHSKIREIPILYNCILNAGWKIDVIEDGIAKRHIVKPTKKNRNMVTVCYTNPNAPNFYRAVTILPNRRDNQFLV